MSGASAKWMGDSPPWHLKAGEVSGDTVDFPEPLCGDSSTFVPFAMLAQVCLGVGEAYIIWRGGSVDDDADDARGTPAHSRKR